MSISIPSCKKYFLTAGLHLTFLCLFCAVTNAQAYTWGNVAMGGAGFVTGIIPSKTEANLVYARTDVGGAYRWDAAGSKWVPLLDWASENETGYMGVESIATDPVQPNKVYMLVGTSYFNGGKTAILYSNDRGANFSIVDVTAQFKAHGNGMGRQSGEKLVVDPNNNTILFCGTRRNGLFKSSNSGLNWAAVPALAVTTTPNDNGISFVVMDPSSATAGSPTQTLLVGVSRSGSNNLFRSNDGGQTFTPVTGAPSALMPQRAVLASDRNLYIAYANGAGPYGTTAEPMDAGQLWKYNLQTGAWTNITPAGFARAFGGISVDPANPARVVASSVNTYFLQDNAYGDRIFLSTNGGTSWKDVVAGGFDLVDNGISWINGQAIHWAGSVEFDPFDSKKAWIISGNGVFRTDDIDASLNVWKFQVKGLEETVPLDAVSIPNGPLLSVIGDYDGFRHTDVTQYGPIHTPRMGTTTSIAYASLNSNVALRVGSKMYYTLDMGLAWTECTKMGNNGYVAVSANGNTFLHCPENATITYRSVNKGTSWSAVTGLTFSNAQPVADPVDSTKFYVYNPATGSVYISTNGGSSFTTTVSLSSNGSRHIRTVPGRQGHIWVALYGGGLTRSVNSGQAFTAIGNVTYCAAVGIGKEAPGSSYPSLYIWGTVNNVLGIYRSTDEGANWTRVNDDAHEFGGPGNGQFVIGDMNVYGRVYMSTVGRGLVYGETNQTCIPVNIVSFIKVNTENAQATSIVTVLPGARVLLTPEPLTGGSWSWTGPNNFTATTREVNLANIQATQAGIYTAKYTDVNGCTTAFQPFTVNVNTSTAVPDLVFNSKLVIYPNPSPDGNFLISSPELGNLKVTIEIYTDDGRLVFTQSARAVNNKLVIKPGLQRGMYVLKIIKNGVIGAKKIMY